MWNAIGERCAVASILSVINCHQRGMCFPRALLRSISLSADAQLLTACRHYDFYENTLHLLGVTMKITGMAHIRIRDQHGPHRAIIGKILCVFYIIVRAIPAGHN